MPSHVEGKSDNGHKAPDQAKLPEICLVLPVHKEEVRFFSFFGWAAGLDRC